MFFKGTINSTKADIKKSATVKRMFREDELHELGITLDQAKIFMNPITLDGIKFYQLIN